MDEKTEVPEAIQAEAQHSSQSEKEQNLGFEPSEEQVDVPHAQTDAEQPEGAGEPTSDTEAAGEQPERDYSFLEGLGIDPDSITLEEATKLLEGDFDPVRIKELSEAVEEAERGGADGVLTDLEGDIDGQKLAELKDEFEENPKLVRTLKFIAKMNEGSSMARFIDAFFIGPKDFSQSIGRSSYEDEAGLELVSKEDFKNALKDPSDFAKKFDSAFDKEKGMREVLKFSYEDKSNLEKAKSGDVKALKEVLEAFVAGIFAAGTDTKVKEAWENVRKNLGEEFGSGKFLANKNLEWFYHIYDHQDSWSKYLPKSS